MYCATPIFCGVHVHFARPCPTNRRPQLCACFRELRVDDHKAAEFSTIRSQRKKFRAIVFPSPAGFLRHSTSVTERALELRRRPRRILPGHSGDSPIKPVNSVISKNTVTGCGRKDFSDFANSCTHKGASDREVRRHIESIEQFAHRPDAKRDFADEYDDTGRTSRDGSQR